MPDPKAVLDPLQYLVHQQNGTEPPFRNTFWDHHEAGVYVDILSGEPLFTSLDKFDSGCGWPSFYDPAKAHNVETRTDTSMGVPRTEVICAKCGGHLGHVFTGEGFKNPTDKRYCINGGGLKFVPAKEEKK